MAQKKKRVLSPEEQAAIQEREKKDNILRQMRANLLFIQNSDLSDYLGPDIDNLNAFIANFNSLSIEEIESKAASFNKFTNDLNAKINQSASGQVTQELASSYGSDIRTLNDSQAKVTAYTVGVMDDMINGRATPNETNISVEDSNHQSDVSDSIEGSIKR